MKILLPLFSLMIDPDADRLACATKMKKYVIVNILSIKSRCLRFSTFKYFYYSGEWYVFSGNELGALLGWWMLHTYQVQHPDTDFSNVYMLASTVSSKILASMAKQEGFNFEVCIIKYL